MQLAPIQLPPKIAIIAVFANNPAVLVVHSVFLTSTSFIAAQLAKLTCAGVSHGVYFFMLMRVESLSPSAIEVFYRVAHVVALSLVT